MRHLIGLIAVFALTGQIAAAAEPVSGVSKPASQSRSIAQYKTMRKPYDTRIGFKISVVLRFRPFSPQQRVSGTV